MPKHRESTESTKMPAPAGHPSFFPLSTLRDDIDRAFGRMFHDWPRFGSIMPRDLFDNGDLFAKTAAAAAPRVDVSEDDNSYEITADLPGIAEKDIEVTVKENFLTLRGEQKTEREETKKDYHMTERSHGSFARSFRLPDDVDADKIKAEFDKGVLTLTLPKTAEAKAKERKIPVKGK